MSQREAIIKLILRWKDKLRNCQALKSPKIDRASLPKVLEEGIMASIVTRFEPLDFCVWSILEKEACATAHTNTEVLKKSLKQEWAKIPQQTFPAAVKSFRRRFKRIIEAKGKHIKN